jgi:GDP-L-fucose synthase
MAKNKYISCFKNKKILITGGTGLIGMPLAQMLIDMGAKVSIVSLDNLKIVYKFVKIKK